jgi:Predicted O-linked N-acetylglucosamine transferase, SPINDLY family
MIATPSLETAVEHHRAGRLAEARRLYQAILSANPDQPDALHLLGLLCQQSGDLSNALELIDKATQAAPEQPLFHLSLGAIQEAVGNHEGAVLSYQRALHLKPGYFEALFSLGNTLAALGRHAEARDCFLKARLLRPDLPSVWLNLGNAYRPLGETKLALECYQEAVRLKPDYVEALNNLALMEQFHGDPLKAIDLYRRAISHRPDYYQAHANLGGALHLLGRDTEAVASYRQALVLHPNSAETWANLAPSLADLGLLDEALSACCKSIHLAPDARLTLANLTYVHLLRGETEEAIQSARRLITLHPERATDHSNYLLTLHYSPSIPPETIFAEHRAWNERHALPLRPSRPKLLSVKDPGRRLRIGYVSADFRRHSVAFFLRPLLAAHDRLEVEVFCYADNLKRDDFTAEFRLLSDHWRDSSRLTDEELTDQIRRDEIDILVDLAGHTSSNRLLVFARKPAPLQITWLGYPNTTGLDTIDYRITDSWADPLGQTEPLHSERLLRLPKTFLCYWPDSVPPLQPPQGPFTFGCFNNLAKINEPLIDLWARILIGAPGSRLLLKGKGLREQSIRDRYSRAFEERGVDSRRLAFLPYLPDRERLMAYNQVDVALDTFPYHGTTTTCDALLMGVPVVTLAGRAHVSRVGVSLLEQSGLGEWIARTPDEYVALAVQAAERGRAATRQTLLGSSLTDNVAFARDMERAYREIWKTFLSTCG